jgi:manganese/zinc/iron transport system ATP- binding protein
MSFALTTHQLTVNYDKTPVLWDIELQLPEKCFAAVVGPNGSGKSTLIKTAMGLMKPLSGQVEFFGEPLAAVRNRVAYVPQRESVDWDFPITVRELVLMGRYGRLGLFRRPRAADYEAAEESMRKVGMESYADRQINQLSGGQQQRAFLARAFMQDADLYLMDEPFAGIDHTTEKVLVGLLQDLRDQGKTVVVVHHDLNTVEMYFDWVVFLNMRLVGAGEMKATYTKENLAGTYGQSHVLLGEAAKLAEHKSAGLT